MASWQITFSLTNQKSCLKRFVETNGKTDVSAFISTSTKGGNKSESSEWSRAILSQRFLSPALKPDLQVLPNRHRLQQSRYLSCDPDANPHISMTLIRIGQAYSTDQVNTDSFSTHIPSVCKVCYYLFSLDRQYKNHWSRTTINKVDTKYFRIFLAFSGWDKGR